MLNPGMKSWSHYEWLRQTAEALKEQRKPEPRGITIAPPVDGVAGRAESRAKERELNRSQERRGAYFSTSDQTPFHSADSAVARN
jgi:hypothetical protein